MSFDDCALIGVKFIGSAPADDSFKGCALKVIADLDESSSLSLRAAP